MCALRCPSVAAIIEICASLQNITYSPNRIGSKLEVKFWARPRTDLLVERHAPPTLNRAVGRTPYGATGAMSLPALNRACGRTPYGVVSKKTVLGPK